MVIPDVGVVETFARMPQALPVVRKFLMELAVAPCADAHSTPVQQTARGLLDRAACWFGSIQLLGDSQHYQAHLACFRTMIEITADLVLAAD